MFFATISCSWKAREAKVSREVVRTSSGLSEAEFDAALVELDAEALVWRIDGDLLDTYDAADFLRHSIGPPGRPSASAWSQLRVRVFESYGKYCAYCRKDGDLEIDHIVPLKLGGSNHFENLLPACKSCNSAKGGKEWLDWLKVWKK